MTLKSQFLMPHCCTRNGPLGFNCPSLLAAPPGAHLDLVAFVATLMVFCGSFVGPSVVLSATTFCKVFCNPACCRVATILPKSADAVATLTPTAGPPPSASPRWKVLRLAPGALPPSSTSLFRLHRPAYSIIRSQSLPVIRS